MSTFSLTQPIVQKQVFSNGQTRPSGYPLPAAAWDYAPKQKKLLYQPIIAMVRRQPQQLNTFEAEQTHRPVVQQ